MTCDDGTRWDWVWWKIMYRYNCSSTSRELGESPLNDTLKGSVDG